MNRSNSKITVDVGVKCGDVAKADDPFGMFPEFGEIELVNDPDHTIPAPGTHDRPNTRIVQHTLKIRCSGIVCTTHRKIPGAYGAASLNFKSPAFHQLYRGLYVFH